MSYGQQAIYNLSTSVNEVQNYYDSLKSLNEKPSYELFSSGLKGYSKLNSEGHISKQRYLSLIDFTLSANERRLWVIDLKTMSVVHNSLVSHGKKSGNEFALKFSNKVNSNMSSLGFYITGNTYYGKHGYSLYLDGMENGFNDKARERAIVIHSANYATWAFIKKYGRLGRSFGCPALPPKKGKDIINTMKEGSCLFIYFPSERYLKESKYFNP